jgi:hypothetical protein
MNKAKTKVTMYLPEKVRGLAKDVLELSELQVATLHGLV